jgi:hypothetical protein
VDDRRPSNTRSSACQRVRPHARPAAPERGRGLAQSHSTGSRAICRTGTLARHAGGATGCRPGSRVMRSSACGETTSYAVETLQPFLLELNASHSERVEMSFVLQAFHRSRYQFIFQASRGHRRHSYHSFSGQRVRSPDALPTSAATRSTVPQARDRAASARTQPSAAPRRRPPNVSKCSSSAQVHTEMLILLRKLQQQWKQLVQ